jgi:2-isopropylmalate synthase
VRKVSEYTGVAIPPGYPLAGRDAFRTATGVHAAAVIKAERLGDHDLADRVYSSVAARDFGRRQEIAIGHQSGRSNVIWWLREHGYPQDGSTVDRVLTWAKQQDHVLADQELHAFLAA